MSRLQPKSNKQTYLHVSTTHFGDRGVSSFSFHRDIEKDFALTYAQSYTNDELVYRSKVEFADVPISKIVTDSVFIPLTEEQLDEYFETGKFSCEEMRNAIIKVSKRDTSRNLECLL